MRARTLARTLGIVSLGLGLAEVLAPRRLSRGLGVTPRTGLVRGFGLREIVSGVGLLAAARKAPWLWTRVAGDALDIATLLAARRRSGRPGAVGAALAGVGAITALDLLAARRSRQETARAFD